MMNDCVPDFGIEQEDPLFSVLGSPNRRIRPETNCDELAEILWQKGPVFRRFPPPAKAEESPPPLPPQGIYEGPCELFMGEDELAQWLHQPVEDLEEVESRVHPSLTVLDPPVSRGSTVIDSNKIMPLDRMITPGFVACENRATGSSSGGDGRKRKAAHLEPQSDDEAAEHDSLENKRRDNRRPPRRTRAAEVHNLSERRRRDRINEKMKALQQLIPRCNKTDKASMLDDAVEYLKFLQLQIQMMSMGCAMPPMMYPGIAPMGMLMGMGMEQGANRIPCPVMPYPHAPLARMPMQALHPPQVFADGKPSESMPAQSMNITNPFFPYFTMQQMPPPQQDHAGTSKSTVEMEKPVQSS